MAIAVSVDSVTTVQQHGKTTRRHFATGSVNLGNPYTVGGQPIAPSDLNTGGATTLGAPCTILFNATFSLSDNGELQCVLNGNADKVWGYDTTAANAEYGAVDLSAAGFTARCSFEYE